MREEQTGLRLGAQRTTALQAALPEIAQRVVDAIVSEIPSYADPFRRGMGAAIERAVELALTGFLELAARPGSSVGAAGVTGGSQVAAAAYALGRGEARAGRSMDALTSAYGVGSRVAWRELGARAIASGLPASDIALMAELVFAFINELSVQSINGHAEELASAGRIRERRLERLAQKLLAGLGQDELSAAAALADWDPPRFLIAVIVPGADLEGHLVRLSGSAIAPAETVEGLPSDQAVLLVRAGGARERAGLIDALTGHAAVIGPLRRWSAAQESYRRALTALALVRAGGPPTALDSDAHLLEIVVGADPDALADLRASVLEPLDELRESAREKLTITLRSWLAHHGRREEIAADLGVHPQTVRYRMGQLRDLFGDRLTDPRSVLELTVALAIADPGTTNSLRDASVPEASQGAG